MGDHLSLILFAIHLSNLFKFVEETVPGVRLSFVDDASFNARANSVREESRCKQWRYAERNSVARPKDRQPLINQQARRITGAFSITLGLLFSKEAGLRPGDGAGVKTVRITKRVPGEE